MENQMNKEDEHWKGQGNITLMLVAKLTAN